MVGVAQELKKVLGNMKSGPRGEPGEGTGAAELEGSSGSRPRRTLQFRARDRKRTGSHQGWGHGNQNARVKATWV